MNKDLKGVSPTERVCNAFEPVKRLMDKYATYQVVKYKQIYTWHQYPLLQSAGNEKLPVVFLPKTCNSGLDFTQIKEILKVY